MKNFYIIANRSKTGIEEYINSVREYLESKKAHCTIDDSGVMADHEAHTLPEQIPEDTECIIVLGGDGTLLRAANDLADIKAPFLGINLGTLGFLAAVDKNDTINALDRMLHDDYVIEKRMMIFGNVKVDGRVIDDTRALNEIVFTGIKPMQLINLTVFVNGQMLNKYYADGLIISTPTGSTGYNLSAGGPIINPTAQMMIMTPICPHTIHNRSIVFSGEDVLRIEVDYDRYGVSQEIELLFDGMHPIILKSGDSVTIRKSEKNTKIVKLKEESFFETLHNKLED